MATILNRMSKGTPWRRKGNGMKKKSLKKTHQNSRWSYLFSVKKMKKIWENTLSLDRDFSG